MTLKLIDCAITINSQVWQTWKVSYHVVSPMPWWEFSLLMDAQRERPMIDGYSVSWTQSKSKDHEDLDLGRTLERRWSYVHKILDRDMFHKRGIVMPCTLIWEYETWQCAWLTLSRGRGELSSNPFLCDCLMVKHLWHALNASTVQVSIFHPVCGNVNIDHQAKQLNFGRESGENTPNLQFSDFLRLFQFLFWICN